MNRFRWSRDVAIRLVNFLTGKRQRTLAKIRNKLAHGYPFDGFPNGGLLELVRDLIDYAYRDWPRR